MLDAIQAAIKAWDAWDAMGAQARAKILQRFAERLSGDMQALVLWRIAVSLEKITAPLVLPGPTGEANSLTVSGRGLVVCASEDECNELAMVDQICTALLAGNVVYIFGKSSQSMQAFLLEAECPPDVVAAFPFSELPTILNHSHISVVAYCGAAQNIRTLNHSLAQTFGIITQLIAQDSESHTRSIDDPAYINRFITERTLTINTTAIGGNASLLGLAAD